MGWGWAGCGSAILVWMVGMDFLVGDGVGVILPDSQSGFFALADFSATTPPKFSRLTGQSGENTVSYQLSLDNIFDASFLRSIVPLVVGSWGRGVRNTVFHSGVLCFDAYIT